MSRPRGRPYGWRTPDPRCIMVNVRLTTGETATLDAYVKKERTNRGAVVRAALRRYLKGNRKEDKIERARLRAMEEARRFDPYSRV